MSSTSVMTTPWQPTASFAILQKRAQLLARIREFFNERQVLEVETPLMSQTSVTDPHITSIPVRFKRLGVMQEKTLYLQTSPEYAMKRLLAAGSGPIYQLSKAFRQGEIGKWHNPEFTLLEWYRPSFDHHALMDEMSDFFKVIADIPFTERVTVANVFEKYVKINPHQATLLELKACANQHDLGVNETSQDVSFWLDLLFSHLIEPQLGQQVPLFVYDYPVLQAALAKIRQEEPPVASRFEVYFKGLELANGFHELQDVIEQRKRFENNAAYRLQHGLDQIPIDERFLSALKHGLPNCAGVALGVDRLCMILFRCEKISDVISFAHEMA